MKHLSNDDFIDAWIEAHATGMNQSDLARNLGMTRQAVSFRANKMRNAGVKLPRLNSIATDVLNKKLQAIHE